MSLLSQVNGSAFEQGGCEDALNLRGSIPALLHLVHGKADEVDVGGDKGCTLKLMVSDKADHAWLKRKSAGQNAGSRIESLDHCSN